MKVHDVVFEASYNGNGGWSPWDLWRHEYDVDPSQVPLLIKGPLDDQMESTASRVAVYRYIKGDAGWVLLARQANFTSNWGPSMKVLT